MGYFQWLGNNLSTPNRRAGDWQAAAARWHEFDEAPLDAAKHPNEYKPLWLVVEIDQDGIDPDAAGRTGTSGRAGARGRTRDAGATGVLVVYG